MYYLGSERRKLYSVKFTCQHLFFQLSYAKNFLLFSCSESAELY